MKRRILVFHLILVFVFSTLSFTPGMLTNVSAADEVCEINGTLYATLDAALAAVTDGETITLLNNIDYNQGITITDKNIIFDLNGFDLNVDNGVVTEKGLVVTNGGVDITGSGEFNVTGSVAGVYANNAAVTVTNATSSGGTAAYADNGGEITVNGNAEGYAIGAYAVGAGSSVSVSGDVTATGIGSRGAEASNGGSITIDGNVQGGGKGAYALDEGSIITIGGDVTGTDNDSCYGAFADAGTIVIGGNTKATGNGVTSIGARASNGGSITIDGDAQGAYVGVYANGTNSTIDVKSNVISAGEDGYGAYAELGAEITIDGTITAAHYIMVNAALKAESDMEESTTMDGYFTYVDGVTTVWVKETASPVAEIDGTQYTTLDDALNAVLTGEAAATTIKLLQDIDYAGGITVSNKKITFDLDGKTLSVNNAAGRGLYVTGGSVIDITNPGAFNVTGSTAGLYASNSTVKVTNANGDTSYGVSANNSDITVTNDVISNSYMGAAASGGSKISVGGNVAGAMYGAYAQDADTEITVDGDVSATGDNSCGVHSRDGAAVMVLGNVTATGNDSLGANLNGGGTLTVDGIITAQTYIMFGIVEKTAADITTSTTKTGYSTYTDGTSTVWVKAADSFVAEIEGTQYATLDEALAEVGPGEAKTIRLLDNIDYNKGISIASGQNITFDLNEHTLTITNNDSTSNEGIGLLVKNGSVGYTGLGALNVTGVNCGVSANGGGASATVTNATASSEGGNGAVAINGGDIIVNGNAQGGYNGVSAANLGSTAVVNGNAIGTASDSSGARAGAGASVTINGGNARGGMYGIYSNGEGSNITINNGDAIGTGAYSHGVHTEIEGTVEVNGNVQGTQYGVCSGDDTYAVVTGNVTVTAEVNGWGVDAESGGTVEVGGNVVANGLSLGAFATSGGEITIDGVIQAQSSKYIQIFDDINEVPVYIDGSVGSRTTPTTKPGYYTYSAGTCSVWVKIPSILVWPGDSVLTASGTTDTSTVLSWTAATGAIDYSIYKNNGFVGASGGTRTYTVTGLSPNTEYTFKVQAAYVDGGIGKWTTDGPSVTITTAAAPVIPVLPTISPNGGTFAGSITVTITGSGGNVYYTTDGSNPTMGSSKYTTPFTLSQSATVKAAVRSNSNVWSGVASAKFTITALPGGNSGDSGGGGSSHSASVQGPNLAAQMLDSNGNVSKTVTVKLDKSTGTAAVNIDAASLTGVFDKSKADGEGVKTVKINIPQVNGAKSYEPVMPASFFTSADAMKAIEINTSMATVTVPGNMLQATNAAVAQNVSLTIAAVDKSRLTPEVQAQIGSRPVIELNLKIDGRAASWSNESAPVTVSIPYTPTAEELKDPEHITVWYIDGSGKAVSVPSGSYDPATGKVTFSTTHFSKYAVAFSQKTFNDLGSVVWAKDQIEVLASKGILTGISEKEYDPTASITRADFLYYLVRTLGVDAKGDGNFEDISSDAYYYKEIGIAKKLGITSGMGNNMFNPDESITRQDMAVLTERALRMLKKLKQQGMAADLEKFSDKSLIAAYAANSVASLVKEGLLVGSSDSINPLGNMTRAEAAVLLYRIYYKH